MTPLYKLPANQILDAMVFYGEMRAKADFVDSLYAARSQFDCVPFNWAAKRPSVNSLKGEVR